MEANAVPNGQVSSEPDSLEQLRTSVEAESIPSPKQSFDSGTSQWQVHGSEEEDTERVPSPDWNQSPPKAEQQRVGKRGEEESNEENARDRKRSKTRDSVHTTSHRSGIQIREEAEVIHAESQRLLRETKGTSFAPEQVKEKPVSSLLEKIRQRRLQIGHSVPKKLSTPSALRGSLIGSTLDLKHVVNKAKASANNTAESDEIEIVMYKPPDRPTVKQEPGESSTSGLPRDEPLENTPPVAVLDDDGEDSGMRTPDIHCGRSTSVRSSECMSPPKSFMRAPLVQSQDLYSDSQLSPFRDECQVGGNDESPIVGTEVDLHVVTEPQDDNDLNRWLEEDEEKENRDPTVRSSPELFSPVSHVRGLVDDEAEDEDDDPLEDEDDDNDDDEAAGELRDLLTQDAGEKAADIERRSELHSKWLEQQELAMEDSILNRIESGWKNRGKDLIPALLTETQEISFSGDDLRRPVECGENSRVVELSTSLVSSFQGLKHQVKEDMGGIRRVTSSGGQGRSEPVDRNDYEESSDDEEAEENLRRQLFLEESEEQTEFLSVVDDESSKEIFSLINKVNVTTIKPRTASAHSEVRTSGTGHHHPRSLQHQSSFLRRKVTTSVTTTRQGSGNSRSYVFGRDDSNSRDSSRADDKKEQTGNTKSFASSSGEQKLNSTIQRVERCSSSGAKGSLTKEVKPRGPSLFQVLKQQAAELASGKTSLDSLSGSSSRGDDLSIFLAVRPSKRSRISRGT